MHAFGALARACEEEEEGGGDRWKARDDIEAGACASGAKRLARPEEEELDPRRSTLSVSSSIPREPARPEPEAIEERPERRDFIVDDTCTLQYCEFLNCECE